MDGMIAETVAELVTEFPTELIPDATQAVAEITEIVTEVAQTCDHVEHLDALVQFAAYQAGFQLFFVIVLLCFFVYKLFRIFF